MAAGAWVGLGQPARVCPHYDLRIPKPLGDPPSPHWAGAHDLPLISKVLEVLPEDIPINRGCFDPRWLGIWGDNPQSSHDGNQSPQSPARQGRQGPGSGVGSQGVRAAGSGP